MGFPDPNASGKLRRSGDRMLGYGHGDILLGNVASQHVRVMRHLTGSITIKRDNVPVTYHHVVLWPVVIAVADHFVT